MPYRLREPLPEIVRQLVREIERLRVRAAETRRESLALLAGESDALALHVGEEFGLAPRELDELARRHVPAIDRDLPDEIQPSYADRASAGDWELRTTRLVLEAAVELRESLRRSSAPIEWRASHGRPLGVAYDEARGRAEWRDAVGVWDAAAKKIEWVREPDVQVAGVFDPKLGRIDWRKHEGGIAGVWNPDLKEIEWNAEGRHVRVAGVWNPIERKVEWRSARRAGIAGAYDAERRAVAWRTQDAGGIAACWRTGDTGGPPYRTSSSWYTSGWTYF
jgi:hypothetical protein